MVSSCESMKDVRANLPIFQRKVKNNSWPLKGAAHTRSAKDKRNLTIGVRSGDGRSSCVPCLGYSEELARDIEALSSRRREETCNIKLGFTYSVKNITLRLDRIAAREIFVFLPQDTPRLPIYEVFNKLKLHRP